MNTSISSENADCHKIGAFLVCLEIFTFILNFILIVLDYTNAIKVVKVFAGKLADIK